MNAALSPITTLGAVAPGTEFAPGFMPDFSPGAGPDRPRAADRLRALLAALPAGVVVVDRDGRVSESNPAADRIFGEALAGRIWRDVVRDAIAPCSAAARDVVLRNGRHLELSTCSLGNEPGQILLLRDVTDVRELELKITRMQRLSELGRTVASIAHQIRTPLACAMLHASNLHAAQPAHAPASGAADRLLERLRHLERLLDGMLTFASKGRYQTSALRVGAWLDAVAASLASRSARLRVTLHRGPGTDAACLLGNAQALQSIIESLVDNAGQASAGEVAVEIRAAVSPDGSLALRVRDDGPGIPAAVLPRVFDPFFTTRARGTGLGLSVVRSVAESHGGRVEVDCPAAGGTEFTITIPLLAGDANGAAGGATGAMVLS